MKIKDIILFICMLPIFLLSSCVNDAIQNQECSSFDLIVSAVPTETKAVSSGYDFASDEEVQINNLVVAIFDNSTKNRVGYKAVSFTASNSTYDNKKAYKIENITSATGTLLICVVANSSQDLSSITNYTNFVAQATSLIGTDFNPSNLVKFGQIQTVLLAIPTQPLVISLTQVASKVKVKYSLSFMDVVVPVTIGTNTVSNLYKTSKVFLPDYVATSPYTYSGSVDFNVTKDLNISKEIEFYTYEKNSAVNISFPITINSKPQTKSWSILPVVSTDCKTNGFVHGNYYEITANVKIESNVNCTVNWEVRSFSPVTVTIPNFQ